MSMEERKLVEVDQYIAKLPANIQEITAVLRDIILQTSPEIEEQYKWSMPNYAYHGLVCYLQASKKHVNFGFQRGNELENELLEGTGKTMRHIKITKLEDIDADAFTALIQAAMALNQAESEGEEK